jgi:hypothetical protein
MRDRTAHAHLREATQYPSDSLAHWGLSRAKAGYFIGLPVGQGRALFQTHS